MLTEKVIEKLEGLGFKRWKKAEKDRLYINAKELGLECEYYKTGSIHRATFRGYPISNSEAYRMKADKTYIDVTTGEVYSTCDDLKKAAEELLLNTKGASEEEAGCLYIVQIGYQKRSYYQTRAEAMAKAEEEAGKPENDGQRIRIAIQHDFIDLWGDKEYIVIRNWNRTKEELTQEIAQIINEAEVKSNDDYEELCELAGMSEDWKKATGTQAKVVIAAAAEKLGIDIGL